MNDSGKIKSGVKFSPVLEGDTFGQRLHCLRKHAGLSQRELAKKLGYKTPATISRAEKEAGPFDQAALARIASILNADLHWLITGELSPKVEEVIEKVRPHMHAYLSSIDDRRRSVDMKLKEYQVSPKRMLDFEHKQLTEEKERLAVLHSKIITDLAFLLSLESEVSSK